MTPTEVNNRFADRTEAVAQIASQFAIAVDAEGRFPAEAFEAMRHHRLLGIQIPGSLGGEGATVHELAEICRILGTACASSAMIYAMHQIQLASLLSFSRDASWHLRFIQNVAASQLLLASSTTEAGVGGNLRQSNCAVEENEGRIRLEKNAPIISYGAQADAILVTSRRSPDATAQDQVLVVLERANYSLEKTASWDAFGMRGTCSDGYILRAEARAEQVLPASFSEIAAESMQVVSHILWTSVWFGIACEATTRVRDYLRGAARRVGETTPPGVLRLVEIQMLLQSTKAIIEDVIHQHAYEKARPDRRTSSAFSGLVNNVKIVVSENVIKILNESLMAIGVSAYSNASQFSLCRLVRDAYSSVLMISNDRIRLNNASLALLAAHPVSFAIEPRDGPYSRKDRVGDQP
ncbi:acyl-CoA dehydrogenase family protein [Rhizobium leguminosarum]|uniref:acyl-CoA dehydrogenase family protein n=1 Tax=Rhizobium leguminosarum TaxID=384 RepID=UPI0021B0E783|nr:acyl-CoA dehydrogenase family protein [Rhizobium leguminosarum]